MAVDNAGALAVSSIAIGQTVTAYQFFLPRLSEVREAGPNDVNMCRNVYMGQVAAAAVSVGVGTLLSVLTGSKIPVFTSVFIALIIAGIYHYAMRSEP